MAVLIAVFVVGWIAASVIGTQAYFRGEQTKPIHERNWRSESFEKLSESITGTKIDYSTRVPAFDALDAYTSSLLPNA
ncbi:photosystem II protein, Psb35-related [Leptothermofonsia sp. ETS-13]|uniref:photosystem II protein, Psb35-related n=1 Tax=Leptothermofonsia sp. ETS-13 TaxID=3035696 RepID=UPI003B9FC932